MSTDSDLFLLFQKQVIQGKKASKKVAVNEIKFGKYRVQKF